METQRKVHFRSMYDLPEPVDGVITLRPNTEYIFDPTPARHKDSMTMKPLAGAIQSVTLSKQDKMILAALIDNGIDNLQKIVYGGW